MKNEKNSAQQSENKRQYESPRVVCLGKLNAIIRGVGSLKADGIGSKSGARV